MNSKIVPFNRAHLSVLEPRSYEAERIIPFLQSSWLEMAEMSPYCYSMVIDGRVITLMGCFPLWDGVWEVWQIPSVYVLKYAKEYCKTIRGLLDGAAKRINIWRMQSHSPADELHDRWMKFVGFECEGTLKEYSRFKDDYRLWVRRY